MSDIHEMVRRGELDDHSPRFVCRACGFVGTLLAAIQHAVRNQFIPR